MQKGQYGEPSFTQAELDLCSQHNELDLHVQTLPPRVKVYEQTPYQVGRAAFSITADLHHSRIVSLRCNFKLHFQSTDLGSQDDETDLHVQILPPWARLRTSRARLRRPPPLGSAERRRHLEWSNLA